jgi:hypothetical protein
MTCDSKRRTHGRPGYDCISSICGSATIMILVEYCVSYFVSIMVYSQAYTDGPLLGCYLPAKSIGPRLGKRCPIHPKG